MTLAERARRVYESRLRAELEPQHRDQFVAIEPVSESFFLGDQFIDAAMQPKALFRIENLSSFGLGTRRPSTWEGSQLDRNR